MNISKITLIGLFSLSFFSLNAQIKLQKPKIQINNGSGTKTVNFGKDPSGLFSRVSDDPSAESHRKNAVENLTKLEAEYAKSSVDYEMLTKLIFENERTLGHILKLEPDANSEKYYEKYTPLKTRADKENAIYADAQKLEKLFEKEFRASTEFKSPELNSFRSESYGGHPQCYCRNYRDDKKTYAEYVSSKAEYEKLTSQLVGYKDAGTMTLFTNMEVCLKNGDKYAIWASKENVQKEVLDFSAKNKVAEPKDVIKKCEKYLEGLGRIESDFSLNLSTEAKAALAEGKKTVTGVKTESETYISSGAYQKYLDKIYAEKIAKVFLPKAVTVNAKLEEEAKQYVKGTEYAEYLKSRGDGAVASTVKAVTLTKEQVVVKNDFDLPKYQYHEIWVSYKGANGKCYMTAVYASYTYKGGGTYATVPTWGADAPEEMSCLNVSK